MKHLKEQEQKLASIVGIAVYGAAFRLRAKRLLEKLNHQASENRISALAVEDDAAEEVIVWGSKDGHSGGGGVDVITLNAWMSEYHIRVTLPKLIFPDPDPPTDDTPSACQQLEWNIQDFTTLFGEEEDSIKELESDIENATSAAEKRALRAQLKATKASHKKTEKALQNLKDQKEKSNC